MGPTAFNVEILVRIFLALKLYFVNVFWTGFTKEKLLLLSVEKHWSGGSSYCLFCAVFLITLSG
jgi:hypothetical protein